MLISRRSLTGEQIEENGEHEHRGADHKGTVKGQAAPDSRLVSLKT
jgi:hypothetical protein